MSIATTVAAPQSVARIFAVLTELAREPQGDKLSALARRIGAPKSSLISLLAGMRSAGILRCDVTGRYRLGPQMVSLAMLIMAGRDLPEIAHPILERLVAETGETTLLGMKAPDDDVTMYIDKVESPNPVRYTVWLGERRELYCSALGKLILAYMRAERRDQYFRKRTLKAFTPATVTSVRKLNAELARICERGLSRTDGERVNGVSALAAPVFAADGSFASGLIVAGPSERIRARADEHAARLKAAASELSLLLAPREMASIENPHI